MRRTVPILACWLSALLVGGTEQPSENTAILLEAEITAKVEESVKRACDWLAKNQNKDGGLKSSYSVASTGLAGLAWMASGSTPHEGPYADNIRRALNFLIKNQNQQGFITEGGGFGGSSSMYGHGYSTQLLAQSYGMIRSEELGQKVCDALKKAVKLIETTQNSFGGWNSSPNAALTDDGSGAVAIMQITALRTAQSAGIPVRNQIIEKSKKYLLEMTNDQGWYAYNYGMRGSGNSAATTGAGMYMIGALGMQGHPKYSKGIRNLMSSCPFLKSGSTGQWGQSGGWGWYYYTCFYASLAIFQKGGAEWAQWYPAMSKELIKQQRKEGNWDDNFGGVFTSLAVLSLELPYRYLPMFLEGGAGREGK